MSTDPADRRDDASPGDQQPWRGRRSIFSLVRKLLGRRADQLAYAALFVLTLTLFAGLIFYLLFAPKRTPVIALTAGAYEWPVPPHAWSREDIEHLAFLNGKTITLRGADREMRQRDEILRNIQQIQQDPIGRQIDRARTVIVYVGMHGVSDASNQPLLIPPGASVLQPEKWLSVEELLTSIQQALPHQNTLVIFDCDRIQVNWSLGLLYNSFAGALQHFWDAKQSEFPRLAILNSTGPDQRALASSDLSGSVFSYYLRRGLAGEADDDQNRRVALSELSAYLTRYVSQWAAFHRGAAQQPMLLRGSANLDFDLARTLSAQTLRTLAQKPSRGGMAVAPDELDRLWSALDNIRREERPYRHQPQEWSHLENRLLWLEQLSTSGSAYHERARDVSAELQTRLQWIRDRLAGASRHRSVALRCCPLSDSPWSLPEILLHSLPLAEYLERLDPSVTDELRLWMAQFVGAPSQASLAETLRLFAETPLPDLVERRFLNMMQRYQNPELWQASGLLVRLADVRQRAEELAVPRQDNGSPGDERAHHWVRRVMTAADHARRDAEDRLFIDGQLQLGDQLQTADGLYAEAAEVQRHVTQALEVRDDAFAQTLYLAHWLTHPALIQDDIDWGNAVTKDEILPLINETFALARAIADHNGDPQRILAASKAVEASMASLTRRLDAEVKTLTDGGDLHPSRLLGRLEAILQVPVISPADRRELLRTHARITAKLHEDFPYTATDDAGADIARSEATYPARADSWEQHPVLAAISPSTATISSQQRTWFRLDLNFLDPFFDAVAAKLAPEEDRSDPLSERWPRIAEQVSRSDWSTIEQVTRASAPIWFADDVELTQAGARSFSRLGSRLNDPIASLRELDVQELLLWHAERALTDFWGAAGQDTAFYEEAARDYLQAAQVLSHSRAPEAKNKLETLNQQLAARQLVARNLLVPTADDGVVIEANDGAVASVSVRQNKELADQETLAGTATIMVRDTQRRLPATVALPSPGSLPLSHAATKVQVRIAPSALATSNPQFHATAMFRGHEFDDPFAFRALDGARTSVVPHIYDRTQVTLHGRRRGLAVVFVLDCSHSMRPHLDVAKKALTEMLSHLALRGNVRVGVYLFGHRVGWTTDRPVVARVQRAYSGEIPPDLTPNEDVERISSLSQDFDLATFQQVEERLGQVVGWGQSPLYRSLVNGLEEFGGAAADAERHVVVITDGMNYLFFPSGQSTLNVGSSTSYQDVINAWQLARVPIHIIGLGINSSDQRQTVAEFKQLTQWTGGHYYALDTTLNLTATLQELFAPPVYNVEDALGNPVQPMPSPLGVAIAVPLPSGDAGTYEVRYESARQQLELDGGEAIDLYVGEAARSIHAFPFDQNVSQESWLQRTSDGQRTDHLLRVHQPFRQQRDAIFPVSVQCLDSTVTNAARPVWTTTERPEGVWVEITPLSAAGDRLSTYYFYDVNCEPEKPVPLLSLVAREWPAEGSRAEVHFWCKPVMTNPQFAIPWGRERTEVEVLPGVSIETEAGYTGDGPNNYRVRVVERHDRGRSSVGSIKIDPPAVRNLGPVAIRRQFDAEAGIAAHWFTYAIQDARQEETLRDTNLLITTRAAVLADSWQPERDGLIVEILEAGELMQLVTE